MTDDEILQQIRAVVGEETQAPPTSVTLDASANSIPGWDSLAHTRIVMNLESRLGVFLDMDATYRAANIGALIGVVRASLPAKD
jgi:acyl carrier protein